MEVKREFMPFLVMLFALLPFGYYMAGSIVYNGVAFTNTDCWGNFDQNTPCLLYTSPSPRDYAASRMPSSA